VLYRLVLPRTYRVDDYVWVKIQSSIRGPAQGLALAALEDMHWRLNPTTPGYWSSPYESVLRWSPGAWRRASEARLSMAGLARGHEE